MTGAAQTSTAAAAAPKDETPEQKKVREWNWDKEPHDWKSVPTYFTPEAYNPAAPRPKASPEDPFPANTVDEVRALPALMVLQRSGALSPPAPGKKTA